MAAVLKLFSPLTFVFEILRQVLAMVAPPTAADGNRVSPAEQLCSLFFCCYSAVFFCCRVLTFLRALPVRFFLLFSGHGGGFHAVGSNRNPPAKKFSFCDCFLFCFWFSWFCFVFLHSVRIKLMAIAVRSNRNQLATLVIKNIVPKRYRRNRPRWSKVFFGFRVSFRWMVGFMKLPNLIQQLSNLNGIDDDDNNNNNINNNSSNSRKNKTSVVAIDRTL